MEDRRRDDRDRRRSYSRSYSKSRSPSPLPRESKKAKKKKAKKMEQREAKLFKSSKKDKQQAVEPDSEPTVTATPSADGAPSEGTVEYWNEERRKLGLKPLKEA